MTRPRITGVTGAAPAPAGPYSQSRRIGNIVTCSGQAGITPEGRVVEGIEEQCRQTFANLKASLAAVGADLADVAQLRVYLTDPNQFAAMNAVSQEVFGQPYPTRTTVYVVLPGTLLVEIDAFAVLDE